jgi:hypothetical protein
MQFVKQIILLPYIEVTGLPLDPMFVGSNPNRVNEFLRGIKSVRLPSEGK